MDKKILLEQEHAAVLRAKALIDEQSKWVKGAIAADSKGAPVDYYSNRARCFCISGALRRAVSEITTSHAESITLCVKIGVRFNRRIRARYSPRYITMPEFNDDPATTHNDVMRLFDDIAYEITTAMSEDQNQ